MATVIEQYENKKGELVLEILAAGNSYRYQGKLDAGCGRNLNEIKSRLFSWRTPRQMANIIKRDLIT